MAVARAGFTVTGGSLEAASAMGEGSGVMFSIVRFAFGGTMDVVVEVAVSGGEK